MRLDDLPRSDNFEEPGDVELALQTASAIGERPVAAAGTGLCRAGRFHPRFLTTTHSVVHHRPQIGGDDELRYLCERPAMIPVTNVQEPGTWRDKNKIIASTQ